MNEEYLILVDEKDQQWGKIEKLKAHELGLLHRAFSIFLFNNQGELLLQQRAKDKYHSPGLWTNTCCSHPHFGEETKSAVYRRLQEEMGMGPPVPPVKLDAEGSETDGELNEDVRTQKKNQARATKGAE